MRPKESDRIERKTISVEEAARWLGVSRNGAYEAVKRGEIPTIKIGRLLLVPVAPFERLLGLNAGANTEAA